MTDRRTEAPVRGGNDGATKQNQLPKGRLDTLKHDFLASIVVFLVALPLCMGIAIASGVPSEKAASVGIITGIVGGLVVGLVSGCPLQVSGPAAGLIVLIYELQRKPEVGWERFGLVILLAGSMQLVAGIFRLGQWFRAVAPAVVHGMLAGIGVVIVASQFHIMLDDKPKGNGLANIMSMPEAFVKGVVPSDDVSHDDAARIGLLTISAIFLWRLFAPKAWQIVPAPLVAVVIATVVSAILILPIQRISLPGSLLDAVQVPVLPPWNDWPTWKVLLLSAGAIAFIASAETLLCATAVDQMKPGSKTKYEQELMAQGVGNMICGALGALPMTGVIVRSSANIEAGGQTRASAMLHGIWLLISVTIFGFVLRYIPTASLAGILIYTGYRLVKVKDIKELWHYGKMQVVIYFVTMLTIVVTDLLTGVIVGMSLAIAHLLYTFSHLRIRVEDHPEKVATIVHLEGAATFLRLPQLAAALEKVPPNTELHIQLDKLSYIDHACLDLLTSWEKQHEATGGSLVIDWESLTARFKSRPESPTEPASPVRQAG